MSKRDKPTDAARTERGAGEEIASAPPARVVYVDPADERFENLFEFEASLDAELAGA